MFDFLKKKKQEINPFHQWIDSAIQKCLSLEIVAYNFNLYEGSDENYQIELIGANYFDKNDSDWPCSEVFSTGTNIFLTKISKRIMNYDQFSAYTKSIIGDYLKNGKYSEHLRNKAAIWMGFTDGDLVLIYENPQG